MVTMYLLMSEVRLATSRTASTHHIFSSGEGEGLRSVPKCCLAFKSARLSCGVAQKAGPLLVSLELLSNALVT